MERVNRTWPENIQAHASYYRRFFYFIALFAVLYGILGVSVGHAENRISLVQMLVQKQVPNLDYGQSNKILKSELDGFYTSFQYKTVWIEKRKLKPMVVTAIRILQHSSAEGLNPQDYRVEWLDQQSKILVSGRATEYQIAYFDVILTAAWLQYGHDLHEGRVESPYRRLSADITESDFDGVAWLRSIVVHAGLAQGVSDIVPRWPLYQGLKEVLARYRPLEQVEWVPLNYLKSRQVVVPGGRYSELAHLYDRLLMLGDLSESDQPTDQDRRYDGAIVQGVQRFQARHGLVPNGVLTRQTIQELNRPIGYRIHQIEASMERLRWLPVPDATLPFVIVNIPSFHLMAFSDIGHSKPVLSMKVIVGMAETTPTPLLKSKMKYIQFNPYWNVPQSILRKEILPKFERDPSYLRRKGMEVAGEDDAYFHEEIVHALEAGRLRVRQKPGSRNALGKIKFVIPNPMNIYLHATPGESLFQRARRDFSHGCIRLEQPVALAEWVLSNPEHWPATRIQEAMDGNKTRQVSLPSPIPVFLTYYSASIDELGQPLFFRDIYFQDEKLLKALQERKVKWPQPIMN